MKRLAAKVHAMSGSADKPCHTEPPVPPGPKPLEVDPPELAETVCSDFEPGCEVFAQPLTPTPDGPPGTGHRVDRVLPPAATAATAGTAANRYRLGPRIGHGGMGVIYQAWDTQLDREIAIKVIREKISDNPTAIRRFLEEARITGELQHPGVVPIHELGRLADGRPYFVMSRVHGETLEQILNCRGSRNDALGHLLFIFERLCDAVAYAHTKGVIHRDLKPANVMVGPFGLVNLMDWGLAKVLGEPELLDALELTGSVEAFRGCDTRAGPESTDGQSPPTLAGTVVGTPAYIAPEQAQGQIDRIGKPSDVFGLGSILCEILTGRPPYVGASFSEVFAKSRHADLGDAFQRLSASAAPAELINLAICCLAPDPADRPASAVEVARLTTDYLQSEQRRAERELVRFFNLSLDLFCIANPFGYFVRVNENFSRLLGYTSEELTSHPFCDYVHPDDRARTEAEVARLNRGEPCIQFTNRYRHVAGHFVWLEWNALSVPEERVIYAVARDVTDRVAHAEARRQHEAALARSEDTSRLLTAVLDSCDDAVICRELNEVVRSWNKGAEQLFGYASREMVGRPFSVLVPSGRLGDEQAILERLDRGERPCRFETVRVHKDGQPINVLVTASPIRDDLGQVLGVFEVVRRHG
jgi:serine/threonine-protein kinase